VDFRAVLVLDCGSEHDAVALATHLARQCILAVVAPGAQVIVADVFGEWDRDGILGVVDEWAAAGRGRCAAVVELTRNGT